MTNYKAIKVLRILSADEFKQFGRFVKSPFFNSNKNLIKLYVFLKKHYPEFKFTNEHAFKYLFPGKKYYDAKVRQLLSEVYKLCEDFLAHTSLDSDTFAKRFYIIRKFDERKLDSLFLRNVKKMELELNSTKIGRQFYERKSEVEKAVTAFFLLRNRGAKIGYKILKRGEYFLSSILRTMEFQYMDTQVQEYNYGKPGIPDIMNSFINHIDLKRFSSWLDKNMCDGYIYIAIMCNFLLMEANPEEESFFYKSKNLIFDNYRVLSIEERTYLIDALTDYCLFKVCHPGNKKLREELFELNKLSLTFLEDQNSIIQNAFYHSILENALVLGKFQWAESFIHNYTKYTKNEQDMRNFALGRLCFEKSEYEKSLEYLKQVNTSDPMIKYSIRRLILKLYYELDMFEPGISYFDSLQHFRRNSKEIGEDFLKSIDTEIRIFNKLLKLKIYPEKITKMTLLELKELVPADLSELSKKWFFKKIDELGSKFSKQRSLELYSKKPGVRMNFSPGVKEYSSDDY